MPVVTGRPGPDSLSMQQLRSGKNDLCQVQFVAEYLLEFPVYIIDDQQFLYAENQQTNDTPL